MRMRFEKYLFMTLQTYNVMNIEQTRKNIFTNKLYYTKIIQI